MNAKAKKRRPHTLLWLALPTLVLLPLVLLSTFWHVPTRVQLEVATARLAVTLGGQERREIFSRSVPFSSLVIERCKTVAFAAEKLEISDPQQLVAGTKAEEAPHFPATAWQDVKLTDPVRLSCSDPAAKVSLKSQDHPAAARLGVLDRIYFEPGSQVVLEASPGREPAVSAEIGTPQDLHLALGQDLELVADLVKPDGIHLPFPGDLLTFRARLPEAHRMIEVTSGEHGLVLIVTPPRDQLAGLFAEPLDLPLSSVEMLEEDLDGRLVTPLRDKATLSYPDYPDIPAVTLKQEDAVGLGGLSDARLLSFRFDTEKGALRATFDGKARRVNTLAGALKTDRRLTLFQTLRYDWLWQAMAAAATWLVATTWAVFKAWQEIRKVEP